MATAQPTEINLPPSVEEFRRETRRTVEQMRRFGQAFARMREDLAAVGIRLELEEGNQDD